MKFTERFYPESRFGGYTDIDGTISFYSRVNSLLEPCYNMVDVGCGRGEYSDDLVTFRKKLRILRGKVKKVIGIDVDNAANSNPFIDEFHKIKGDSWPIEDDSVDIVLCDNVLEHIEEPKKFFTEVTRVLKNNGYLCIRTPNRNNYIALISLIVPNKYHSEVTSFAQEGRKEKDVFPTYYRCNTANKIKRMMAIHGFESVVYGYEAEPSYLSFSNVAFYLGVLHQKFAPKIFKPSIFAFGKLNLI